APDLFANQLSGQAAGQTADQAQADPQTHAPTPMPTPAAPQAEMPAPVAAPQQPAEVASTPPMPAPIAAPEAALRKGAEFNPGLPSARDIMLAPAGAQPENAAAPGGLSADAAKSIEQKLSVLLARLDTFEGRITNLESGL